MERVRVLQGCSIQEGGLWYHQGAVLDVEDASKHFRTLTDAEGKTTLLPCTEPAMGVDSNQPKGLTPGAASDTPRPKPRKVLETPVPSKEA